MNEKSEEEMEQARAWAKAESKHTYHYRDRVVVVGGDTDEPTGMVVNSRNHPIPGNPLHGMSEEQVNVRLDGGGGTGFIPVTLVRLLEDKRPVTEQTHDPVQGLPVDDGRDDCLPQAGRRVASQGEGRARPYLEPVAKEPATLNATATDLEDLADWMKHGTLGSIKMRELRQRIIGAAIKVKGCAEAWRREKRPIPREAPLPGTGSWVMKNMASDLGTIMMAVDNYLESKIDRTAKPEILDRMKRLAAEIREKQEVWVETEREVVKLHQELQRVRHELAETAPEKADRVISRLAVAMGLPAHVFLAPKDGQPEHKLLFFGPSVADDRTTKEMKRTGTLPESQMDERINEMLAEGWRVVYRHYDPSFHVEQWRVILEKP